MLSRALICVLTVSAVTASSFGVDESDDVTMLQTEVVPASQADGDVDHIDENLVSLLQVNTQLKTASKVDAEEALYFTQQKELFKKVRADALYWTRMAESHALRSNDTEYFISNNGLLCVQGPDRTVEGGLALLKAGLHGMLYSNTYGGRSGSCSALGYSVRGGEHKSYPGLQTYAMNHSGLNAFSVAEQQALTDYRQRYALSSDAYTQMLHACTCHPQSYTNVHIGKGVDCIAATANQTGAWVHHDVNGNQLLCNEGPFQFSTFSLAVIKSTAQLLMNRHDQIAATSCASLGFTVLNPPNDHCFTQMHVWTRTDINTDPAVTVLKNTENSLFHGGVFDNFCAAHSLNQAILHSLPGCHCASTSAVYPGASTCNAFLQRQPPIRDWWHN